MKLWTEKEGYEFYILILLIYLILIFFSYLYTFYHYTFLLTLKYILFLKIVLYTRPYISDTSDIGSNTIVIYVIIIIIL